jgi:adenylate cyclase
VHPPPDLARRFLPLLLGLLVLVGLVLIRLADPYPVRIMRDAAFDTMQQLAPRPHRDMPVRVIDIDDASLAKIGQWPWPRSELATLTSRLGELGAAAIAFDMLFPEPDRLSPSRLAASLAPPSGAAPAPPAILPDYDRQFAAALAATPSVLGFAVSPAGQNQKLPRSPKVGFAVSGSDPAPAVTRMQGAVVPLEALEEAAHGLGSLSLEARDSAAVVREVPLLWRAGRQYYPSLALEALRVAMGVPTIVILGDTGGAGYVEGIRLGDFTIPTTPAGDLTLYYDRAPPGLTLSARDILAPDYRNLAPLVRGQIVLVGSSATALGDLHATALGTNVPGVAIHAEIIGQILSGAYLTRTDWVVGLELLAFAVIGLAVIGFVARVGPLAGLLIGMSLLAVVVAGAWYLFRRHGLLVDPSYPLAASFVLYSTMVFLRFAVTDADRRKIRRAFSHYVSPALLTRIETSRDRLRLGGETRDVTVMFADMRNFTTLSENLAPEELLAMLNTLFGALGAEVVAQSGTIDKFIGDALMAFWNAPVDVADHARKACMAALAMRARLAALNAADGFGRRAAGREPAAIAIGMGLATGPALVGNMGLESRFDYSALGDTVNTASRVESACKAIGYDIAAVEETRAAAFDFALLPAGAVALKGKAQREPLHLLVGDVAVAGSLAFRDLATAHEEMIAMLRENGESAAAIARCKALATAVEPGLLTFYDAIPRRRGDFQR